MVRLRRSSTVFLSSTRVMSIEAEQVNDFSASQQVCQLGEQNTRVKFFFYRPSNFFVWKKIYLYE